MNLPEISEEEYDDSVLLNTYDSGRWQNLPHPQSFKKRTKYSQPVFSGISGLIQSPGIFNGRKWEHLDIYEQSSPEILTQGMSRRAAYEDFTTIDWIHDNTNDRARQRLLNNKKGIRGHINRILDISKSWTSVLLIGVLTGFIAGFINISSEWLSDIKDGFCTNDFYLNQKFCCWLASETCSDWKPWSESFGIGITSGWWINYIMYVFWATSFATLSAYLVTLYSPYASGSGIPEIKTILGGFVIKGFLGFWTLLIKVLGLVLSVASGMALGKEGPLVHVACCVGNLVPRMFSKYNSNEAKKRELLSVASAAGVSVAFGAPIGGVLFSLEEVSYYFPYKTMWRSFVCAMVAAISLRLVNPFRTGKLVLFQVEYKRDWHDFELPIFVLLGALGGIYGSFFTKMNLKYSLFRKTSFLKDWGLTEVFGVALITGIINFPFTFLRVNTSELVANLFRECSEVEVDFNGLCEADKNGYILFALLFAASMKIFLNIITFGIRVPAGIFIPSMAIGACVGRIFGIIIQNLQKEYPTLWIFSSCKTEDPCVTPGTYAMVGAAAALAGVTRMTVSLTVIMFELTGALSYVLPIMLTVMVANFVGNYFTKSGIYDGLIRLNKYPYLDSKDDNIYSNASISDIMTKFEDLETITASGYTIDSLNEVLEHSEYQGFPVVSSLHDIKLLGYAGKSELKYAIKKALQRSYISGDTPCYFTDDLPVTTSTSFIDLKPWIDLTPFTLHPKFPIQMAVEIFKKLGLRYALITVKGRLCGILTKKDVLRHLHLIQSAGASELSSPLERATG